MQKLQQSGCRGLLFLSGERGWVNTAAAQVLESLSGDVLLVGSHTVAGVEPTAKSTLLGQECDLLLWDLYARPDLNTLAASGGCLVRSGLLLVLAPAPQDWYSYFTCDDGSPSHYWQHVLRCIEQYPQRYHYSQTSGWTVPDAPFPTLAADASLPTADQLEVMALVRRVLHGHRRRPLVIRADRGRGKSALLGLCAAEFLQEDTGNILITAPRRQSVVTLFNHATEAVGRSEDASASALVVGDSEMVYYPPDQLLKHSPPGRILLVDEAAAIPPALLEAMVKRYPRVVFATTVHGYEGSGRGFDIRFADSLDRIAPQWHLAELQEPIRWSEGDPLEGFLNRCFLLDAEPVSAPSNTDDKLRVEWVDKMALLADEDLLRQIFGLLVAAHYQTSPSDLQQLMDSLATSVFVLRSENGAVLGAALVMEEGGLPDTWLDPVQQGQRRLQGHLLPQSLTYHLGVDEGLRMRCARVSRIAVHQSVRRRGLGRLLLGEIENFSLAEGLDYVASSFAADSDVLPFWLGADYVPLRLGIRRDPCSGSRALLVARPLSELAARVLTPVCERFAQDFPLQLREIFSELDWKVALGLLNARDLTIRVNGAARRDAQRFAVGEIAYEHAYAGLYSYLANCPVGLPETEDVALALKKVLQGHSWKNLADEFQLAGRKALEQRLRQAYRFILSLEG